MCLVGIFSRARACQIDSAPEEGANGSTHTKEPPDMVGKTLDLEEQIPKTLVHLRVAYVFRLHLKRRLYLPPRMAA
jgi:hypothetical protein